MYAPDPAKQALRRQLLELRQGLTQIDERSAALSQQLLEHPLWIRARGIAAFVGVRNEPHTRQLLERSLAAGKTVWLPRLLGRGRMAFWPCTDLALLEPASKMGLLEPPIVGEGVVAPGPEHGVDLMLVPGLGFGRDGARIGFGAGHYDRALASRETELPTLCGVCFSEFLDPLGQAVPMASHDVRMHYVATELGVERCNG